MVNFPVSKGLLHKNLCISVVAMTTPATIKSWLSDRTGKRVTASDIAEALGVSRNTANSRLADGLNADDLIHVCRHLSINPIEGLVDLGHVDYEDAHAYVGGEGTLLETASTEELVRRLAEESLSLAERIEMGADAKARLDNVVAFKRARAADSDSRSKPSTPDVLDMPEDAVAHGVDFRPEEDIEHHD